MKMTSASLTLVSLLPAAALLVAACAVDTGDTGDPGAETPFAMGAPAPESPAPARPGPRSQMAPFPGQGRAGSPGNGDVHMVYRGGPVISNVKVFTLFWSPSVENQSALDSFYGAIVDSAYIDGLAEYDTSTQKIGRGKYLGTYVDSAAPAGAQVNDDQVQQEIGRLIDAGQIPQPDADTLYMVHFPAGVTITMQSYASCRQFCAYHSSFTHGSGAVYYGIMPDFSGACASCGGEPTQFDSTTVVASHEVAEAITDPNIGIANATGDERQLGWYDDKNSEIADVCQGQSFTLAGYRVTELWSNQQNACVADGEGSSSSCSHGVCVAGAALSASCGSCTAKICDADAHCCSGTWDQACVQDAVSLCGKSCQ
jgi:hypothetical protein